MGESRRRKAEIESLKRAQDQWLAGLTPAERTAAEVSERTHTRLVERKGLVGGCYLLAFFLNELLHTGYSVETELVVGWVNDGTWPGLASHAWVELGGKKIDISVTQTDVADSQLTGDLLILDRVVRPGAAKYAYYREAPDKAVEYVQQAVRSGDLPAEAVESKTQEHAYIAGLARTREGIRTYFTRNPPDRTFEALARIVG
jgi:hypothetical protein